jgi:hypothetical protein
VQCYLLPLRARASMLSLSDRMVPTSEQSSYFQNALRNINASLNIPTVVKLKKKRAKELLGGSGGKDKLAKDKKPLLSMQDHKTIFSQVSSHLAYCGCLPRVVCLTLFSSFFFVFALYIYFFYLFIFIFLRQR